MSVIVKRNGIQNGLLWSLLTLKTKFLQSIDDRRAHILESGNGLSIVKLEDRLNSSNFRGSSVITAEGDPVVDDETGSDDVRTAVDGSVSDGDLKESSELLHILNSTLGVNESTIVGKASIRSDEGDTTDGVTEDFDAEDVSDNLLSLAVQIRVNEGDVVVASNHVTKSRKLLLNSLNDNLVRESVTDVHHFLVGRGVGQQESLSVTRSQTSYRSSASNR